MTNPTLFDQCKALLDNGSHRQLIELLTPIVDQEPNNFNALQFLGLALHLGGKSQAAINVMRRALKINSENYSVHHNIAGAYRTRGKMPEAERHYREVIRLKPDLGEAYQGLAEIVKSKDNTDLLSKIDSELKKKQNNTNASYLHFAAGKILDDTKQYSKAFEHYQQANQLIEYKSTTAEDSENKKQLYKVYTKDYFINRAKRTVTDHGSSSKSPIFIVGMPRSGSTLVEQILSSHSAVFGAGEIRDIHDIAEQIHRYSQDEKPGQKSYPWCMPDMPAEVCKGFGDTYLHRVSSFPGAGSASHYVDKYLYNFDRLGLITDILPNAHIIHLSRHPLNSCLSCFFQNFSGGVNWSFNLQQIVEFYRNYRETMAHWRQVSNIKILDIKYEELISAQEKVSREMIEFCGLPWETSCLNFHTNKRIIKTASVWQARQPIYQSSKDRWHNYKKHITILIEGLSDYIEEYETDLTELSKPHVNNT